MKITGWKKVSKNVWELQIGKQRIAEIYMRESSIYTVFVHVFKPKVRQYSRSFSIRIDAMRWTAKQMRVVSKEVFEY